MCKVNWREWVCVKGNACFGTASAIASVLVQHQQVLKRGTANEWSDHADRHTLPQLCQLSGSAEDTEL